MSAFAEAAQVLAAELRKRLEAGDMSDEQLAAWIEQLLELGAAEGLASAVGHRCLTIKDILADALAAEGEDAERDEG